MTAKDAESGAWCVGRCVHVVRTQILHKHVPCRTGLSLPLYRSYFGTKRCMISNGGAFSLVPLYDWVCFIYTCGPQLQGASPPLSFCLGARVRSLTFVSACVPRRRVCVCVCARFRLFCFCFENKELRGENKPALCGARKGAWTQTRKMCVVLTRTQTKVETTIILWLLCVLTTTSPFSCSCCRCGSAQR